MIFLKQLRNFFLASVTLRVGCTTAVIDQVNELAALNSAGSSDSKENQPAQQIGKTISSKRKQQNPNENDTLVDQTTLPLIETTSLNSDMKDFIPNRNLARTRSPVFKSRADRLGDQFDKKVALKSGSNGSDGSDNSDEYLYGIMDREMRNSNKNSLNTPKKRDCDEKDVSLEDKEELGHEDKEIVNKVSDLKINSKSNSFPRNFNSYKKRDRNLTETLDTPVITLEETPPPVINKRRKKVNFDPNVVIINRPKPQGILFTEGSKTLKSKNKKSKTKGKNLRFN